MNSENKNELGIDATIRSTQIELSKIRCDDIGNTKVISGIYRIVNKVNGKSYYGQAQNIIKRFREHRHNLLHNKHINPLLQNAWNKYGENSFLFIVHLYCHPTCLDKEEQTCLDLVKVFPELHYNIGCDAVAVAVRRGTKHSEQTKYKMSISKMGHKNHNFGKHYSDERIKSMSEARKGTKSPQYDRTVYTFINPLYGMEKSTQYNLRTKYNITSKHLCDLIKGRRKTVEGWRMQNEI